MGREDSYANITNAESYDLIKQAVLNKILSQPSKLVGGLGRRMVEKGQRMASPKLQKSLKVREAFRAKAKGASKADRKLMGEIPALQVHRKGRQAWRDAMGWYLLQHGRPLTRFEKGFIPALKESWKSSKLGTIGSLAIPTAIGLPPALAVGRRALGGGEPAPVNNIPYELEFYEPY